MHVLTSLVIFAGACVCVCVCACVRACVCVCEVRARARACVSALPCLPAGPTLLSGLIFADIVIFIVLCAGACTQARVCGPGPASVRAHVRQSVLCDM